MLKTVRTALFTGLLVTTPVFAENAWIDDEVFVPVRAGMGTEYRILHRGLKSGTAVEVLERPEGSDWVKIRAGETEGYVAARYVSSQPTAAIDLARLQQRFDKTLAELTERKQQLKDITAERDALSTENTRLKRELGDNSDQLAHLQDVAADPIRLDQANRQLNEELSALRLQLDTLQAENSMLSSDNTRSNWIVGAMILLVGGAIGLFARGRGSRRNSGWA